MVFPRVPPDVARSDAPLDLGNHAPCGEKMKPLTKRQHMRKLALAAALGLAVLLPAAPLYGQ